MRTLILAALAILFMSGCDQAKPKETDWVFLRDDKTSDKSYEVFADRSSVREGDGRGTKLLWVKTVYSQHPENWSEEKELLEVSCGDEKLRLLQSLPYDGKGNVLAAQITEPTGLEYVVPETLGRSVYDFACFGD